MQTGKRGFTLIELLICCAIIFILAGSSFTIFADLEVRRWEAEIRADAAEEFTALDRVLRTDIWNAAEAEDINGALVIQRADNEQVVYRLGDSGLQRESLKGIEIVAPMAAEFTLDLDQGSLISATTVLRFSDGARIRNQSITIAATPRVAGRNTP